MILVEQRGSHASVFYEPQIAEVGGTLEVPSGLLWIAGFAYSLPAYAPIVGADAFRLWVERIPQGADYVLDLTMRRRPQDAEPGSFGAGIGVIIVAWRDAVGQELYVLRSV